MPVAHLRAIGRMTGKGKTEDFREQPAPSAVSSTTNYTWTAMGLNPAIRSEKPRLTPDEGHIIFIC